MSETSPSALDRPNLSGEAVSRLRTMIVFGDLAAGTRLNEVALADRLGVSRTPIREALSQLVAEGFARQIPRRGFFVAPLSADEVRQLYPLRQLLDPEALRLAGVPSARRLAALSKLNEEIARATEAESIIELDDQWHMALVSACPNRILLEQIRLFMRRTLRYEIAYMSDHQNVGVAVDEHEAILDWLRADDLEAACEALRRNMSSATEPLLTWLATRTPTQPEDI